LFPAITIARELAARNAETRFSFLTSSRDIDGRVLKTSIVDQQRWRHVALTISSSSPRLRYAMSVARSFFECRSEFRRARPDVVIGLGGFASVPGILAAAWLKIPICLLETNAVPGGANRVLSRFAKTTFSGWRISDQHRRNWKSPIQEVGVPVRQSIIELVGTIPSQPPTLLIVGGSQGASSVNRLFCAAIADSSAQWQGWQIVHQTGRTDVQAIRDFYKQSAINATVMPFLDDLPQRIADSELVISRCGAVTLAEIIALQRPAILIPLHTSADQHQLANAHVLELAGAACMIDETLPDADASLSENLATLCQSDHSCQLRKTMSTAAGTLSNLDAAARIVDELDRLS